MSLKSEKLANRIREIQQFVHARINQGDVFQAVSDELAKIEDSLKQGKLTVKIVSREPVLAQALQNFLSTYKSLSESYHFQTIPLPNEPEQAEPQPTAALILQSSSTSTTKPQQTRYEFPFNQKVIIGLERSQCQICLPNRYGWVSRRHAEIRSLSSSDTDNPSWQICDLNSTNGTYINGQQLQECQILQSGDRITLGYHELTEKSPEFIFECQSDLETSSEQDKFYKQLVDCDVLCLIIDSNQILTADEKQLIEKAKSQVTLPVEVDSSLEDELDSCCQPLEKLVKRRPEDIIVKRLTAQVQAQVALIENSLNKKEEALEKDNQQDEAKLSGVKGNELQKQTDTLIKQVSDDKVEIIKEIKAKISNSKADLLDEHLTESITHKISESIDRLEPYIRKQEGSKYIQLNALVTKPITGRRGSKSSQSKEEIVDANTAMIDYCRSELNGWSTEEWKRICTDYAEGGLRGLFQRTYETLNSIPSLKLSNSSLQPEKTVDIQKIFKASFKRPLCENRYHEVSPVGHFLRKARSQWIGVMFLFSFLSILGIAGGSGRRKVIQMITQPIRVAFKEAPVLSYILLAILCYFLFNFLKRAYQNYKEIEREKAAEKLRKNLNSYYQSLVKSRLEKIIKTIMKALEVEEQRLDKFIKTVKQRADETATEVESNLLQLKMRMNKRKEQQSNLKEELKELQKLKRI